MEGLSAIDKLDVMRGLLNAYGKGEYKPEETLNWCVQQKIEELGDAYNVPMSPCDLDRSYSQFVQTKGCEQKLTEKRKKKVLGKWRGRLVRKLINEKQQASETVVFSSYMDGVDHLASNSNSSASGSVGGDDHEVARL